MVKHEIKLTPKERQKLLAMVGKGRNQAVVIRRAHILLKSDEGKTDREICDQLYSTRAETAFFRFALTAAPLPHAGEGLGVRVRKVSYTLDGESQRALVRNAGNSSLPAFSSLNPSSVPLAGRLRPMPAVLCVTH